MKRSWIKNRMTPQKRKRQDIQNLMREIMKIERGDRCQICGADGRIKPVGVFHILPVGGYQRLQFRFENVLLSCWFPCHYNWHHDFEKAVRVKERIVAIKGENYKYDLMLMERTIPRMTSFYMDQIFFAYQKMLEDLTGKKHNGRKYVSDSKPKPKADDGEIRREPCDE